MATKNFSHFTIAGTVWQTQRIDGLYHLWEVGTENADKTRTFKSRVAARRYAEAVMEARKNHGKYRSIPARMG